MGIYELFLRFKINKKSLKSLYGKHDYLKAYSIHSDLRAKIDPKSAVGRDWDTVGKLQFEYLLAKGLLKNQRMLDFGCGTLRAGRYFIEYLDIGNYCGIDISEVIIDEAKKFVIEEGLTTKKPTLIWNNDLDLEFNDLIGMEFDVILAQSVFTHLFPEHIDTIIKNCSKVMGTGSRFYFTFHESDNLKQRNEKDFSQPYAFYQELAKKHQLSLERFDDYDHPNNQVMCSISSKN